MKIKLFIIVLFVITPVYSADYYWQSPGYQKFQNPKLACDNWLYRNGDSYYNHSKTMYIKNSDSEYTCYGYKIVGGYYETLKVDRYGNTCTYPSTYDDTHPVPGCYPPSITVCEDGYNSDQNGNCDRPNPQLGMFCQFGIDKSNKPEWPTCKTGPVDVGASDCMTLDSCPPLRLPDNTCITDDPSGCVVDIKYEGDAFCVSDAPSGCPAEYSCSELIAQGKSCSVMTADVCAVGYQYDPTRQTCRRIEDVKKTITGGLAKFEVSLAAIPGLSDLTDAISSWNPVSSETSILNPPSTGSSGTQTTINEETGQIELGSWNPEINENLFSDAFNIDAFDQDISDTKTRINALMTEIKNHIGYKFSFDYGEVVTLPCVGTITYRDMQKQLCLEPYKEQLAGLGFALVAISMLIE